MQKIKASEFSGKNRCLSIGGAAAFVAVIFMMGCNSDADLRGELDSRGSSQTEPVKIRQSTEDAQVIESDLETDPTIVTTEPVVRIDEPLEELLPPDEIELPKEAQIPVEIPTVAAAIPSKPVTPDVTPPQPSAPQPSAPQPSAPRKLEFAISQSDVKGVTQLVLIVDDSTSMTSLHLKMSQAMAVLVDRLIASKSNVDVSLYSTTLYSSQSGFDRKISAAGQSFAPFALSTYIPGTMGVLLGTRLGADSFTLNAGNGSLVLSDFTYLSGTGAVMSGFDNTPGSTTMIKTNIQPRNLLGTPISIRNGVISGGGGGGKSGQSGRDLLVQSIAGLGVTGSPLEQPLAVLHKVAQSISAANRSQFAAVLVGDEDDSSRPGIKAIEGLYRAPSAASSSPTTSIQLEATIVQSLVLNGAVKVWKAPATTAPVPVYNDGVLVSTIPAREIPDEWIYYYRTVRLDPCGGSSSQCGQVTACNASERQRLLDSLSNVRHFRDADIDYCNVMGENGILETRPAQNSSSSCDAIDPGHSQSFRDYLTNRYPNAYVTCRLNTLVSAPISVAPVISTISLKVIDDSVDYIPAINQKLSSTFGPRGYSLSVIGNSGLNCNQGPDKSVPQKLKDLLAASPKPDQFYSNCDENYNEIVDRLNTFIESTPNLDYSVDLTNGVIDRVVIQRQGGSSELVLDEKNYSVEAGKIKFSPGSVGIGDRVVVYFKSL
jgi:hypothetical protein